MMLRGLIISFLFIIYTHISAQEHTYIPACIRSLVRPNTPNGFVTAGGATIVNYDFTYVPKIIVPDTIYATTTANITLYGDDIINYNIGDSRINMTYTCTAGTQSGNNFVINGISAGVYPLNIKAKIADSIISERSIQLKTFVPPTITDTLTILPIGNSLTYLGRSYYVAGLRTSIGKAKMYGTLGTAPNKHLGKSGWQWNTFVVTGSPFFIGGAVNFAAYRTDSLGLASPLDVVIIELGINDIISDDVDLYDIYGTISRDLKKLVDAIIADNTGNIFIMLPSICENTGAGWLDDYGTSRNQNYYIFKMNRYWQMLLNEFDNKKYNAKVKIAYTGMFIDRDTHYLKTDGVHSSGVHLTNPGYTMMGTATYNSIIGRVVQ